MIVKSLSCNPHTREMAEEFFVEAVAWAKAKGYVVHHESHRKRYLHSPWVTREGVTRCPLHHIA